MLNVLQCQTAKKENVTSWEMNCMPRRQCFILLNAHRMSPPGRSEGRGVQTVSSRHYVADYSQGKQALSWSLFGLGSVALRVSRVVVLSLFCYETAGRRDVDSCRETHSPVDFCPAFMFQLSSLDQNPNKHVK